MFSIPHSPPPSATGAIWSAAHGLIKPGDSPHIAAYLWTLQWKRRIFFGMSKEQNAEAQKSEVLQGTLELMVMKVLDALGPQHGYGIARRIEQVDVARHLSSKMGNDARD